VQELEERRQNKRLTDAARDRRNDRVAENASTDRVSIGQRLDRDSILPRPRQNEGQQEDVTALESTVLPRLVILGDPGCGKTTLLRWLATAYLMRRTNDPDFAKLPDSASLPERGWLPVLIRCRELDKSRLETHQLTIDDALRQTLSKLEINVRNVEFLNSLARSWDV
jgi:predicted NACHT family NTPase